MAALLMRALLNLFNEENTMNIPGMGNLMKQAQAMQQKMKDMETELKSMKVTGKAVDLVEVTLTGEFECLSVKLDESLMKEDKDMVEDLMAAAINDAVRKIEKTKKEKMSSVTAGMNLPAGLGNLLS